MKNLIDQLKEDEGFRGTVYKCSGGANSIAFGRNLDANPLTRSEGMLLLRNDIRKIARIAKRFPFYRYLDSARKDVIIQMIYILGPAGFTGFRNMITALSRKEYGIAADEMLLSKWHRDLEELGSDRAYRLSEIMRNDE